MKMLDRDYIRLIRQRGIRLILLDTYKDAGDEMLGDIVKTESFQPIVQLTRHLIGQGMQKIAFLSENSNIYETMHDRFDGYLYAMAMAGIKPVPGHVIPNEETADADFYNARTFERIVEGYRELPEAVVCGNDEIAKFLTQALRRKGIRVPEDAEPGRPL